MSKLIVNADDFGLHSFVNEAIVEGHRKGIITSTSLLAGGEAFDEAVAMAKELPNLGIGVHIALVGGLSPLSSISNVPTLVENNGLFPLSHVSVTKNIAQGKVNFQEVYTELDKQFSKIMNTGLRITHVDGHQHLHMLPPVLDIVIALMKKYKLNKIRIPYESMSFFNGNFNPVRVAGRMGLSLLSQRARKRIRPYFFRSPDYFWGMINGGALNQEKLDVILQKIANKHGIHEIMTHPGINTTELGEIYNWNYEWKAEFDAMCSQRTLNFIEKEEIELINYGDLR